MARLRINVEVIDEDICANCKKFKVTDVMRKNSYDEEVRVIQCVHRDLCEHLLQHISEEKFLNMD